MKNAYLLLLLLHFSKQELGVDVALLKQMLQSLEAHIVGLPNNGLTGLTWT